MQSLEVEEYELMRRLENRQRNQWKRTIYSFFFFWFVFLFLLLTMGSYQGYRVIYINKGCEMAKNNCSNYHTMENCFSEAYQSWNVTQFFARKNKCTEICPTVYEQCNPETELFINELFQRKNKLPYSDNLARIVLGQPIYGSKGDAIVPSTPLALTYFLYGMTIAISIVPIILIMNGRWCG